MSIQNKGRFHWIATIISTVRYLYMAPKGVKRSKHISWRDSQMPVVMLEDRCHMYFDSEIILYTVNATSDAGRQTSNFFCRVGNFILSSYLYHAVPYFTLLRNEQDTMKSNPTCLQLIFMHNFLCFSPAPDKLAGAYRGPWQKSVDYY